MHEHFSEQDVKALDRIIEARRSIRAFKEAVPSDSLIKSVIHAGIYAPYAGLAVLNKTDYRRFFVIKNDRENLTKINDIFKLTALHTFEQVEKKFGENAGFKDKSEPYIKTLRNYMQMGIAGLIEAPCLIVVAETKGMPPVEKQSLAHILQNMWLKTTVLGLGFRLISGIENLTYSKEFCEFLGLPYGDFAFNGCIIGYPATEPMKRNTLAEERVTYWL